LGYWLEGMGFIHAMGVRTAVRPGARGLLTRELACDRQQIVEAQQQRFSQVHHDHFLLRRERGLQIFGCVRAVLMVGVLFSLVDGSHGDVIALSRRLVGQLAHINLGPDG
jgi:hypothetical protein